MRQKKYPQSIYLFLCYGSLVLVLLLGFYAYFYYNYESNARQQASDKTENMGVSVHNSVSGALDSLSTISMNVVSSGAIRNNFSLFAASQELAEIRPGTQQIYDNIASMISAYQSASQVNLYTLSGEVVGTGYKQYASRATLETFNWYEPALALKGHRYFSPIYHNADIPAEGENHKARIFISLVRIFNDGAGSPAGIVEVVQDCDRIFSLAQKLHTKNPDVFCAVYNDRGELVYPYTGENAPPPGLFLQCRQQNIGQNACFLRTGDGTELLVSSMEIERYGWTVLTYETKEAVFAPLHVFLRNFTTIATLGIIGTVLLCLFISRRLTGPLNKLTDTVHNLTLNQVMDHTAFGPLAPVQTNVREISLLYDSFKEMNSKLEISLEEAFHAHSQELEAKYQAIHLMINPHFLFNSLTSISIMAEEEMNTDIIRTCQLLCDYFRYVSSLGQLQVPLEQELQYTGKYIECMKMRYGPDFTCHYSMDTDAGKALVPKLIVQPFVENAFKHAYNTSPPWVLSIRAYTKEGYWFVEIEDNAGNLTPQKQKELLDAFQQLDPGTAYPSMRIGGMGLKSVSICLKYLYGKQAIFRIESQWREKTTFTIGGPLLPGEN